MKYSALLFVIFLTVCGLQAQTYEVGLMGGGSNFIGDVGRTNYIYPNSPMAGVLLKWNRSPRHAFRFTALFTQLQGDDADSDEVRRQQRGYSFENSITELSLGIEFNFLDFSTYNGKRAATPYLYTGFTYFKHDDLVLNNNNLVARSASWDIAIPAVLGFKASLAPHLVLGVEIGARYTLTDNLDGSYPDDDSQLRFGNLGNNDWYMFSGVTLTYSFGRRPCYCGF